MAGDHDPRSSAHEDDDNDDQFYDPYNDLGHFTEEELQNVMSDSNPNLMDFDNDFSNDYHNPPPSPRAPEVSNMEISETQMMDELSLDIFNGNTNSESFGDDLLLSRDMFASPVDDTNSNIVQGEIDGNDNGENSSTIIGESSVLEVSIGVFEGNGANFVGESGSTLAVSTLVFGEFSTNFEIGGPSTRPVPVTPTTHDGIVLCNGCQLLRGLVHTNGREVMRMDIYGETGSFCHALLETQPFADPMERRHESFVLKGLTMEEVKTFIENYLWEREVTGFTLVHDTHASLSGFYQAVNVCSNINQPPMLTTPPPNEVPLSLARPNEALNVPSVPLHIGLRDESPSTSKGRPRRNTPLAAQDWKQRERTGKMTLDDLKMHFDEPIEKAAKSMEVCPTVLKKVCRRGGLPRWPYRKIKSLQRRIAALMEIARKTEFEEVKATAEGEIAILYERIEEIRNESIQNSKSQSQ